MKRREEKRRIARALIEIKCSKVLSGQTGVFALRNLRKGTIIAEAELFGEKFRSWKEYQMLDSQTKRMIDKYCLGTEGGFYAPSDINWLSIPWHINHSCSGNVGFDEKGNIITIRYIKTGEELFYDYGLGEANPNFKMKCKCGSANCRVTITGNDWKQADFRRKNLHIMMPHLREARP